MSSADPTDDPVLKLGQINRYRVTSRLGKGGMGAVYKGDHQELALEVAVKVLHPHLAEQGDSAKRFLQEARLAARLNHPSLVRVFDCGTCQGFHYIVMEYVNGQNLAEHLAQRTCLPVGRALQIAQAVAEALKEGFDRIKVIHRDIKPGNILLTSSGEVKLGDLGLAKIIDPEHAAAPGTVSGTAMGTPKYMSPEQFASASRVDHRADIYSLGATLYHMLSGSAPFQGESTYEILKQVEEIAPAPLPHIVPANVERIVLKMLAKRPEDRFATHGELIQALRDAQSSLGETLVPLGDTQTPIGKMLGSTEPTFIIPAAQATGRAYRPASPTENRVLLVVDVQNDFCPGGALAVPEGDAVVPFVNRLARRFAHVILTQDWHCEDHLSFASSHPGAKPRQTIELPYGDQMLWPDHCVQGTAGAAFHPELKINNCELVLRKGYHRDIDSYSAFFENDRQTPTGLAGYLRERGLSRLFIVGLATDFCVAYSALDARKLGFEVTVIEEGCRGIDVDGSVNAAWLQMEHEGVMRV